MTGNTMSNGVYTDFNGLTQLRYKASTESPQALNEVGKHFEALFIQMMLQSMRKASPGDPLFGGKEQELYQDLFDKQIAINMAEKSQLGLADLIANQLQHNSDFQKSQQSAAAPKSAQEGEQTASGQISLNSPENSDVFPTPKAFVKKIWPYARHAAEQLNVDPQVLIAQAALESGWGRGIIRHPDGRSSNNLFGIKAGTNWQKETATTTTLEFRNGLAVKERVPFRSYNSLAESFQDYVELLQDNPRYKGALALTDDPRQFADALQQAGYATDPNYGENIRKVLDGDTLASVLTDLKLNKGGPIG